MDQDPHAKGAICGPTLRWLYAIAAVLCVLVTAVMVERFRAGDFKDAPTWYDVGRRVLIGKTLVNLENYRYPPTFAVLISPLCALPYTAFFFVWYGINVILFGVLLRTALRIVTPPDAPPQTRLVWLPTLFVATFVLDNFFLSQTNLLVTTLVYWGLLEGVRKRDWRAGIPLGAAIAIKAFPVTLLLYFVYRRKLKTVAALALSCTFFLLLLPAPVRGLQRNYWEVGIWAQRVVYPYLSHGDPGDWGEHGNDLGNQSLSVVIRRLLSPVDATPPTRRVEQPRYTNVATLSPAQVDKVIVAALLVLAVGFVVVCGWKRPDDVPQQLTEYALALLLVLLVSAVSWTYFFLMLLLPIMVALKLLAEPDAGRLGNASVWGLRGALMLLGMTVLLLGVDGVRAAGSVCWATVALFVALALARKDLRIVEVDRRGSAGRSQEKLPPRAQCSSG